MTVPAPLPTDEARRIERLRALAILDTAPEEMFDALVRLAADICEVPISLVSLVDSDRQWFKANVGLPGVTETPRDIAFCSHAILDDDVMEISDATLDSRFANNPLVTSDPSIRFYAGAPLKMSDGTKLGTLCVIDRHAKRLSSWQLKMLGNLAAAVVQGIEFRRRAIEAINSLASSEAVAAKSERFVKSIADAMPGMVAYWDSSLLCRFANKRYGEWFGKLPEELIGVKTIKELLGEELFVRNEIYIRGVLAGKQQQFERTLTKADGTLGYTWANYVPDFNSAGVVVGFFVLVTDVTPLKEAKAGLELAASVYESIDDGITVTDANATILTVNPAFTKITGYAAEEVIGQNPRIFKSERHDNAFYSAMWLELTTKGRWEGELWNRRKNGDVYPERMSISAVRDSEGAVIRYVAVFNDISDYWRKDEHVRHLAFHDALTDLPNRSLLTERLERQISLSEREHRKLAVLFLDLDGFKHVNDTLGHAVGDDLLKVVAQILLASVRQSDTVARLGGDEFVIMLDNPANRDEVTHIASRIVTKINEPMSLRGHPIHIGTSMGIAIFPNDGSTPTDLVQNADKAMYAAKTSQKNTYRFFDEGTTVS